MPTDSTNSIVKMVTDDPERFQSSTFSAFARTGEAVLDMSLGLPKLRMSWQKGYNLFCLTEEQAISLEAAGIAVKREQDGERTARSAFVMEKARSHVVLCNFRRYSWSWTPEEAGEFGYCVGPCYANGLDLTFLADSRKDVVRDTLVQCWAEMKADIGGGFAETFQCQAVSALLRRLLDDALENTSPHAGGWQHRRMHLGMGPSIRIIGKDGSVTEMPVTIPEGKGVFAAERENAQGLMPRLAEAPAA